MATTTYNVLYPVYEGVNTLDVNGPLDVLCNFALRQNNALPFKITVTGKKQYTEAYEFIDLYTQYTYEDIIPKIEQGEFDILIIPGGLTTTVQAIINDKTPVLSIMDVIRTFLKSDNKKGTQKWLVSICTGALFLGAAGAFNGRDATTHFACLDQLVDVCKTANAPAKSVTRKRWVDGGPAAAVSPAKVATRIASSGGISCGLDCALWLVSQVLDEQSAINVAQVMDYAWNSKVKVTPQQE